MNSHPIWGVSGTTKDNNIAKDHIGKSSRIGGHLWINPFLKGDFLDYLFLFMYVIQHCFNCRPSDFPVSADAGIEPTTVATFTLTARRFNHSARSHPIPCNSICLNTSKDTQTTRLRYSEQQQKFPKFWKTLSCCMIVSIQKYFITCKTHVRMYVCMYVFFK